MTPRTLGILTAVAGILGALLAVDIARDRGQVATDVHVFPGFDPAVAVGIGISTGDDVIALERREGSWWIVRPVEAPADRARIEDILQGLRLLSWRGELASPGDADLAARGLGAHATTLSVRGADVELRVGREEAALAQIWVAARRASGPWRAYLVDVALVRPLLPTVQELRRRRLVGLPPGEFQRLVASEVIIEVESGQPCLRTAAGCVPADPRRIESYLDRIGDIAFVEFRDTAITPALIVTVASAGGSVELALDGPCVGEELRLARSVAGVGCIAEADARAIESAADPLSWIERRLAPVDPAAVDGIEIQGRLHLVKQGSAWRLVDGTSVDGDAVGEYLRALTRFELPAPSAPRPTSGPRIVLAAGDARIAIHAPADGAGRDLFDPSPLRFLDRRVLSFDPHAVTAFERNGARWQRGEALDDWTPFPPGRAPEVAATLRATRVAALAPSAVHGLSPAPVTLHFDVAPPPTEPGAPPRRYTLLLGASAAGGGCYAHRGDGGPVYELSDDACAALR